MMANQEECKACSFAITVRDEERPVVTCLNPMRNVNTNIAATSNAALGSQFNGPVIPRLADVVSVDPN